MKNSGTVLIIATMDTKGNEVQYLMSCFKEFGIPVLTLDAGIMGESPFTVSIGREEVAERACIGMRKPVVRPVGRRGPGIG